VDTLAPNPVRVLEEIVDISISELSIDGETAVVALNYYFYADGLLNNWTSKNSVHVFSRKNEKWIENQVLESDIGDDVWDNFGYESLAIDSETIVIGEESYNGYAGAVNVYVIKDGVWTKQAKLTGEEGKYSLGYRVSLRGDRVASGTSGSQVEIFKRSGNAWELEARLKAPTFNDPKISLVSFGSSFGFDDSADRLLVEVYVYDSNRYEYFKYWVVFQSNEGVWTQQGHPFAPPIPPGSIYGNSHNAVMSDGTVILDMTWLNETSHDGYGKVYTFAYSQSQDQWIVTGDDISGLEYVLDMAMEGRRLVLDLMKEDYSMKAAEIYTRALNGTWQLTEALPGASYPLAVSGDRIAARNLYWSGTTPAACVYYRPLRRQLV
jgi:hypothetical protein